GTPELFLRERLNQVEPAFSPDGRWIAYASAESGVMQVFVLPSAKTSSGGKWQISTAEGLLPSGHKMAANCFTEALPTTSWLANIRREATDSFQANPGSGRLRRSPAVRFGSMTWRRTVNASSSFRSITKCKAKTSPMSTSPYF